MERSTFLKTAIAGAATAGAGGYDVRVPAPGSTPPPYGRPSAFEGAVVRRPIAPGVPAMTPLGRQLGIITPSGLCFTRDHAGIPAIDPARHRLLVHGLVGRSRLFSLDDLMRFPSESRIHFIECAGNSARGWQQLGSGVQFSHGLVCCCEWTGVALRHLLEEAGLAPEATWIVAEGDDAAAFDRSLPIAKAMDDVLVAYGQNGEMLRPEQGYPVRLVVPGYEGSTNVKWLRRIKAVSGPVYSREETSQYSQVEPDGRIRLFDFTMNVKSVITDPSPEQRPVARGYNEVRGYAWSGRGRIARVEVSLDGGATWSDARLENPVLPRAFTRFVAPLAWGGDPIVLASRASDESGDVQPTAAALLAARGGPPRYHANAIASWRVAGDGRVGIDDG